MRRWKSAVLVSFGLFGAVAAQAAPCTTPSEWAALRSAAVQQELMVAGLTCQATASYNRFVITYRGELQASDADLKAYFIKRQGARGEAAYDTFKTKLANLSSLSEISNTSGFCASMRDAFNQVGRGSLAQFVAEQRLLIALPEQQFCTSDPSRPVFAEAAAPERPPSSCSLSRNRWSPSSRWGGSGRARTPGSPTATLRSPPTGPSRRGSRRMHRPSATSSGSDPRSRPGP